MARISEREAGGRNVLAFLDMIAHAEVGPELLAVSDDGYNVIVGSTARRPAVFTDYIDHPRRVVDLPALGIKSTAAGRYQILARYYDAYRRQLGLSNFGPINQDRIALQLIRECRALQDIQFGDIRAAIHKCRSRWASLPGSGYGQREHDAGSLVAVWQSAGGKVIA
ncbi:glycoside hydrolase family 104 protein [Laribacter hongkongensis]|uniref:glycoside hydrolase family 24 protein n=1 Tax=Laribacter hongkongensis TaxID=168471 RepID=UPI001EFC345D|nr:glycoside hydrolase family 104 protein [Laribacter hongkongensis]MCG9107786.1 glycoside hydrolase family 104 protein [Laribacter hongkongensis]